MTFKNKKIELPKLTIEFVEKIEELEHLNLQLIDGLVNKRVVLEKLYDFLFALLGNEKLEELLGCSSFEEVDTKELELLYFYLKTEYDRPLEEASIKKQQESINSLLKGTNMKDVLELMNSQKNRTKIANRQNR